MKILILGYIVRGPLGGLAWHHLQYVILKGDNGKCTTALNGEACIGEGFPIKQMPF